MRIAFISDIHAHYVALQAVLDDIARQHVDSIICLGDVATIGPQPRQVLDRLASLDCACIMGNHDAALLDVNLAAHYQIAPPLIPTLHWCAAQLTPRDRDFLQSFKPVIELALDTETKLLCFHGSPKSNTDFILATTPADELDQLFANQSATFLIGGHSHIQMLRQHKGKLIINSGSVGSAFLLPPAPNFTPILLPWSEYAIFTWTPQTASVDLRRVEFDLAVFADVLSSSDIPLKEWWRQQYSRSKNLYAPLGD